MNNVFAPYRDKHIGERVFVIGNGPSLSDTNLDLLAGETSIAMNKISLAYDKFPKWRPTYYLFSSTNVNHPDWGESWTSSVRESASCNRIIPFIYDKFRQTIDPKNKCDRVKWFHDVSENKPSINGDISEECFSVDIIDRIDKSGTTINLALQLVYFMGFSEVVFVGADLGWTKDTGSHHDPNHFDKSYRAHIPNPEKANYQMRNVHSLAKKNLLEKNSDIKMYNASKTTVLDVYPIIDFEHYMNGELVFRLLDSKKANERWDRPPQFED